MIRLTPPRLITFAISVALIALAVAVASLYQRIPVIGKTVLAHRTWFFVGAYVILALGVTSKSF